MLIGTHNRPRNCSRPRRLLTDDSSLGRSSAQFNLDKLDQWPTYPILFVSSSTGDGDPPENTETFWRQLRRKTKSDTANLDYVRFIVLGLGDSNYDSYQGFPLAVYAKLTQLGAKPIVAVGKADEATGSLEDYVEPWITDLWPDLDAYFNNGTMIDLNAANTTQKPAVETSTASTPAAVPTSTPAPSTVAPTAASTSTNTTTMASETTTPAQAPAPASSSSVTSSLATLSITPTADAKSTTPSTTTTTTATSSDTAPSTAASTSIASAAPAKAATAKVASAGAAKAARGPIAPKPPAHVSKIAYMDEGVETPRFKPTVYPPTKEAPNLAKVVEYRCLTAPDAVKAIYEVALEVRTGAEVVPGEALGLWPENCPRLVERLIKALNVSEPDRLFNFEAVTPADGKATVFPFATPTTVRKALMHHINFTGIVSKRLVIMLAQYCESKESKDALTLLANERDRFKIEVEDTWACVLDILERYPDCKPDLGHLFDSLSALMPRYYSVSNYISPVNLGSSFDGATDVPPTRIFKFIYSLETNVLANKTFNGVATGWLDTTLRQWKADGSSGDIHVPVFIRPRGDFVLPKDETRPIIMAGAGTGLSPFLGFLDQRRHRANENPSSAESIGRAVLFTGHRHPHTDWIYKDEINEMKLPQDSIQTAFSRHHPGKVQYVQDLMALEENGKLIIDLMLNHDAIWYTCGDVRRMAAQVRETLLKLLQTHAGMDNKQSSDKILEWAKGKRYLLDLWG